MARSSACGGGDCVTTSSPNISLAHLGQAQSCARHGEHNGFDHVLIMAKLNSYTTMLLMFSTPLRAPETCHSFIDHLFSRCETGEKER